MAKFKITIKNLKILIIFLFLVFITSYESFAQEGDLEFTLDVNANTTALPRIFKPTMDLSGRGFHGDITWPQTMAAKEVLNKWQDDIGFAGLYRLQYSLWEISQLSKDKESQNKLLSSYEGIVKNITEAGGIVILNIFGTPAGMGEILDKKSPARDLKAFKQSVKAAIRDLSCNKRYSIWYEAWNAPDLEDFFLGRRQEYLNLYRVVAESINELEAETKIHIPLGGPSVSWWFQNVDGNTIFTPEKSLIYELMKFCYHYRLPLDFISWHGFSTAPDIEKENTIYKKTTVNLIRDWLTYFNFDKDTPLIIDEWNFDLDENVLAERKENSFICASYIASRIKNMYEAGIDYQIYFCLEDFQNNKEGVVRNVGIFSFDSESTEYKGAPKSIYNVFRMLSKLGSEMFLPKFNDEFTGVIATKAPEYIALLFYNYIDPNTAVNYLSKNIANLSGAERKFLLNIIKAKNLEKFMLRQSDISKLRTTKRVKALLKKAQELNDKAKRFMLNKRNLKIDLKNLKGDYLYQRYAIDSGCSLNCGFSSQETKEINSADFYQEVLTLEPYSVNLVVLKNKPKEPKYLPSVDSQTLAPDEFNLQLSTHESKSKNQEPYLPGKGENITNSAP